MGIKKFAALGAVAALLLAGCGSSGSGDAGGSDNPADAGEKGFDVSTIKEVPEISAMVPEDIKKRGVLRNGAATDYAPAEFRKADGQTPTGYDIDLIKALAKVMGLKDGETVHGEFASLLPQVGTKFDVSASSYSITAEREKNFFMISYVEVGSAWGVAKGNPKKFDPKDVCGKVIGVQTGTYQEEQLMEMTKKCTAEGKKAIDIKQSKAQTEITPKVVGKQYDASFADSPVIGYAIKLSSGQLEQVGDVVDSGPQGVVVRKTNEPLAKAVQAALQHLMDDGTFEKLLAHYGSEKVALKKAEINPAVKAG